VNPFVLYLPLGSILPPTDRGIQNPSALEALRDILKRLTNNWSAGVRFSALVTGTAINHSGHRQSRIGVN
jgi:hypothetical protein